MVCICTVITYLHSMKQKSIFKQAEHFQTVIGQNLISLEQNTLMKQNLRNIWSEFRSI